MLLTKYRAHEIVDSIALTKDEVEEYANPHKSPYPRVSRSL
jgi:hypothetical protein|nr:MAG TPA: hypothetical protein [Caudoviricetes sp.]